jgi:protein SCO1/2
MIKQFWTLALVGVVFLGAGLGAAKFWRDRRSQPAATASLESGTFIRPRRNLPDFRLIDSHGQAFVPANLRGAWSVLYFGYTNCPDLCPASLSTLARVDQGFKKEHRTAPRVVFISIDAKRDTPVKLAAYVPYFDADFLGVTAPDQATINAFAREFGVAVLIAPAGDGNYTVDHTSALFIIAPDGKLDAILSGVPGADILSRDLRKITAGAD